MRLKMHLKRQNGAKMGQNGPFLPMGHLAQLHPGFLGTFCEICTFAKCRFGTVREVTDMRQVRASKCAKMHVFGKNAPKSCILAGLLLGTLHFLRNFAQKVQSAKKQAV